MFLETSLANLFKEVTRVTDENSQTCGVFICERSDHVPTLHVRMARSVLRAHVRTNPCSLSYCFISLCAIKFNIFVYKYFRVEDHDDLTPIFDRHCDMLSKTYGDYFLAELIEAQDENMRCLVTEVFILCSLFFYASLF